MASSDKVKHTAEGAIGKAKEATGSASDDKSLEAEGKNEQTKASLKKAGDNVKDAFDK